MPGALAVVGSNPTGPMNVIEDPNIRILISNFGSYLLN